MVSVYSIFLGLLAAERLFELRLSRRNEVVALARGGFEVGRQHFFWMRVLHVSFFVGCVSEVLLLNRPFVPVLGYSMFAVAVVAQLLRYWAITSLGSRWNVRVIVVPGDPVVTSGPYRYLRHPNYLAVILEEFAVPLMHSAWLTAVAFSLLNAFLLVVRIRCEEAVLNEVGGYAERFADRRRLLPLGPRMKAAS